MRWCSGVAVTLCAAAAHAYTLKSPITAPCHEPITSEALRQARLQTGNALPMAPDRDERALIDDIPFALDDDMRDLGGATLILAISDNDLKGYSSTDEQQLVPLTADPALQREHCLRRDDEDEPGGSAAALAECRAFIHERVAAALDGLGSDGRPDPAARTQLYVYLTIRGSRTPAMLPTYYVAMAQALHALEDGFAHSYRTADQRQPTVVLNWTDQQAGRLDERRDGPGHSLALDACVNVDAMRATRRQVATQAATELLAATLDVAASPSEKLARTDAIAVTYLTLQAGCTFDNAWCNAPEAALPSSNGCGCTVGGGGRESAAGVSILLAALGAFVACRRRRAAVVASIIVACLAASTARAQTGPPPTTPATTPAPSTVTPPPQTVEKVRQKKRLGPRFGAQLTTAAAVDRAGLAVALGLRFRLTEKWIFGFDGEINPFLGLKNATARPGAFNLYASVVRRYPMTWERVNLRTTLQAGLSTLLFDLYGAPAGSVGPYVGLSVLGLDVDLGRALRLVFDPALVTLPVPHVTGQPFYYLQYRVSVGLSFGG